MSDAPIRVNVFAGAPNLPLIVAQDRGYFERQGISVEVVLTRNSREQLQGLIDGLGSVIGRAGPTTKIIPGHGPTVDRAAVTAHRDVAIAVRDRVAALVAQGKSEDEVVAAKVTADLDPKIQQPGTTGERFVRQAYADLKAGR